jgi:hypothetical protein
MYWFYHTSEAAGKVHAKRQEQYEIQDMASGSVDAVWIFYHDTDRLEYAVTYDEGKSRRCCWTRFVITVYIIKIYRINAVFVIFVYHWMFAELDYYYYYYRFQREYIYALNTIDYNSTPSIFENNWRKKSETTYELLTISLQQYYNNYYTFCSLAYRLYLSQI